MRIEIFTLEYLKFIFSSSWSFLGFIILLGVLTGDMKRIPGKIKAFISKVNLNYKIKLMKETKQNKN
jgi:hypothetical protein